MIYQIILFFHMLVAFCIILLVLIQQGKGASVGAAFGSGASQTVFGSRGSGSFLFRVTIGFVAVFFVTSISLNYLTMHAYKQQSAWSLPVAPGPVIPVPQKAAEDNAIPAAPQTPPQK